MIEWVEKERDEPKQEANVVHLVAVVTGEAKARAENDLIRV